MKNLVTVFMLSLLFVACSQVKDEAAGVIATGVAPVIASYGDCANQEAIREDAYDFLRDRLGSGREKAVGTICRVTVEAMVPELVGQGAERLPEAWECSLTSIEDFAVEIAKETCDKI